MTQDLSTKILSDIAVHTKYAKYLRSAQRRESWEDLVYRNIQMHFDKYPHLQSEIVSTYLDYVMPKKVLPSMRSLQFGGASILRSPSRVFNCAYLPMEKPSAFQETMFLLLGGTGLGYSVQSRHVSKLPALEGPDYRDRRFLVGDSIEGWADAIKVLVEAYFYGKMKPRFDFSDIRPKGAELITSGGKAPGPQPLIECIQNLEKVLDNALTRRGRGTKLKNIEVHDMQCFIADAVLAGGIRRAALICLFDKDDEEMLYSKSLPELEENPQRHRSNNSAVLLRGAVTQDEFCDLMKIIENSKTGEPGVYWTNDLDWGTNPCCEIALRPYQFCNLTEINANDVQDQKDLNSRAKGAAFIGTLQAGYTDFHYLSPEWKEATEEEALIGVGMTGIASGAVLNLSLEEAANAVMEENRRVAKLIGIRPAARCCTVKPSGTSSLVLGTSSGIHAWHNDYYIRRMRVGKNEAIYQYLIEHIPQLVEDDVFKPEIGAIISIPQKAPEGAILRTESMEDLFHRVMKFNREWVASGHVRGKNRHNVSCTISVHPNEWGMLTFLMWKHQEDFNGISVMPYDGGAYVQTPFEDCTAEEYLELYRYLQALDLTQVHEAEDNTDLKGEVACAAGGCEI